MGIIRTEYQGFHFLNWLCGLPYTFDLNSFEHKCPPKYPKDVINEAYTSI